MRLRGVGVKSTNLSLLVLLFLSLSLNARLLSLKAARRQQREQEEQRDNHHQNHPREEERDDASFFLAKGRGGEEEERRSADALSSLSSSVPFPVRSEVYPKCDASRIERNAKLFRKEPTTCPDEKWYDEWTRSIIGSEVGSFAAIEVGCNKGTDAILQLRRFTKEPRASVARFQKLTSFPEFSCSWEKKKWDEAVRGSSSSSGDDRGSSKGIKYRHYCIEASYETFERVHAAAEEMKLADIGLTVHYNAVSSSSWPNTVKFPKITAGQENIGIGMTANPNLKTERYSEFHQTPVITVDGFVRKESITRLDVLKIDTEGNDAAVLIGASMTLLSLKPSYVQFENHGVGKWKTFDLKDSIDMLDAMEYECFWSTNSGKLIQVTNCWHESYSEFKIWSNIACYHRSDRTLKRIMDAYVAVGK